MAETSEDLATPPKKVAKTRSFTLILFILIILALILSLFANFTALSLQQNIQTLQESFDKEKAEQGKIEQEFRHTLETMQQSQQQKQDWKLQKVRFYLELAQTNAHWADDLNTAIALLKEADDILVSVNQEPALAVRQAIAKEIADLKATPETDLAGLLSRLDASQTLLAKLPGARQHKEEAQTVQKPANTPLSWQDHVQQNLRFLKDLVVIRHYDNNQRQLLSPSYKAMQRASIRLYLQEAQWAVLHNNTAMYQEALQRALDKSAQIFDLQAKSTASFMQELKILQKMPLSVPKPSINKSLELLDAWMKSQKPVGAA